ncbi:MAG: PDDEXK nuclease domain-containing protein [Solirubrobacteraceae bacterium]
MSNISVLPDSYPELLELLKREIGSARTRAALAVNQELIGLYWRIGREILVRQEREGWGGRVVERLASDLREAFPEMKGFSYTNLKYMRQFASYWPDGQLAHCLWANCPGVELGAGFAFVGRQVPLDVDGEEFFIDLLFFHIPLNRYVAIELKLGKFRPQYTGQINFYVNVIDDRMRQAHHASTIGLVLCAGRNETVVRYALAGIDRPVGVARYSTTQALLERVPDELRGQFPELEQIRSGVQKIVARHAQQVTNGETDTAPQPGGT